MSYKRHQRIFKKLMKVIPDLKSLEDHRKLKSGDGMMDLGIDVLQKNDEEIVIALSHYYQQNGDLIPDPDMEIRIDFSKEFAEALTYQDSFGYRQVYPEPGKYAPHAMKDLNAFLDQWLSNILNSNYS